VFLPIAAAATAVAVLGLAGFVTWCLAFARADDRVAAAADQSTFWRAMSIGLALLSMLGIVWVALPAMLVAPCGSWSA
jgi:hypothetical protein